MIKRKKFHGSNEAVRCDEKKNSFLSIGTTGRWAGSELTDTQVPESFVMCAHTPVKTIRLLRSNGSRAPIFFFILTSFSLSHGPQSKEDGLFFLYQISSVADEIPRGQKGDGSCHSRTALTEGIVCLLVAETSAGFLPLALSAPLLAMFHSVDLTALFGLTTRTADRTALDRHCRCGRLRAVATAAATPRRRFVTS